MTAYALALQALSQVVANDRSRLRAEVDAADDDRGFHEDLAGCCQPLFGCPHGAAPFLLFLKPAGW